ncbi:MAG: hypothetical protein Q9205_004894 [Flavoplaca limonia]
MPTWLHHPLPASQCIPNFFKDLIGRRKIEEPSRAIPPRQSRVGNPRKDHGRTSWIPLFNVQSIDAEQITGGPQWYHATSRSLGRFQTDPVIQCPSRHSAQTTGGPIQSRGSISCRKDHERTQQILLLSVHPEQPIESHSTMPSAKAVGTSRTDPLDRPIGSKIT